MKCFHLKDVHRSLRNCLLRARRLLAFLYLMDNSDETWVNLISKIESFDCCFQMEVLTGEEGTEDEEEEEEEDEEEEEEDEVSFLLKTIGIVFFFRFSIL